jgi:hypothetical protein
MSRFHRRSITRERMRARLSGKRFVPHLFSSFDRIVLWQQSSFFIRFSGFDRWKRTLRSGFALAALINILRACRLPVFVMPSRRMMPPLECSHQMHGRIYVRSDQITKSLVRRVRHPRQVAGTVQNRELLRVFIEVHSEELSRWR